MNDLDLLKRFRAGLGEDPDRERVQASWLAVQPRLTAVSVPSTPSAARATAPGRDGTARGSRPNANPRPTTHQTTSASSCLGTMS